MQNKRSSITRVLHQRLTELVHPLARALPLILIAALLASSAQAASTITAVDSGGNVGQFPSLVLDGSGFPVVSYWDTTNDDLKLAHCNDPDCAGGDESLITLDSVGDVGRFTSLALDGSGNPVISYWDGSNGDLKLAHCNDANCAGGDESLVTVDSIGDVGWSTSLALDGSGFPVVSYWDATNSDLKLVHCNDPNCAGGDESIVTLDSDGSVGLQSSLALDGSGFPVISYRAAGNRWLKLVHCNDPNCTGGGDTIVILDSDGNVGEYPSLVLDGSGFPVVSYYDATNDDLKLAHCNDPNCAGGDESIIAVDSGGWSTSLALDGSGNPVISRYDAINADLKLAHCNDPNCAGGDESLFTVDSAGDVGLYTSLALDSAGFPVISYYDVSNGDLKLAHCDDGNCEPEMDVRGNSLSITDGDTTPSTADHTDFGVGSCPVSHTFSIQNTGSADLSLTDNPRVSIGGTDAADFSLTNDASTPIAANGQTTFEVTFSPSAFGLRKATLRIANNDADENPYNFSIQGTGIAAASSFLDVPPHHWAWQFIESIFCAGLTAGFPDGTYRPDNPVTRAEIAVFLKRGIHGGTYSPPTPDGSHPFNDIAGHWAEAWIEDLFDEGFTSGFPDGTYRPDNQVTRAEMAVFLKKAIHGSAYTSPTPDGSHPFGDVAGHWAEAWIEDLYDEGITSGYPDGTYRPENQVTRAEMAVFLVSAFNLPLFAPPVIALFELQIGSPTYIPDERGCEHMGAGGKVYDHQGAPIVGLAVRMGGELGGLSIGLLDTLTGSAADRFGFGGYYFDLSDMPVASEGTLWIQVLDPSSGLPLSNKVFLDTFENCEQNLVFVNWQQVGG